MLLFDSRYTCRERSKGSGSSACLLDEIDAYALL